MKKLMSALIGTGLFLSFNCYGFSSDCANAGYSSGLCAPKNCGGFYAGLTGLWLRGTGTGADLNGESFNQGTTTTINGVNTDIFSSHLERFHPKYHWGWEAKIGYDLPCTANNIEINYLHYDDTTNRFNSLEPGDASVSSFFLTNLVLPVLPASPAPGDFGIAAYSTNSSLHYKFDKADIIFGRQYNDVCGWFKLHPYVGVRYARVERDLNKDVFAVFSAVEPPLFTPTPVLLSDTIGSHANVNSEFRGVGPVFGLDSRYGFCNGFGIVGHFDTALLAGKVDSHTDFIFGLTPIGDGIPSEFIELNAASQRFDAPSSERIVAALSGRLGVDYNYCFCNKSSLTVEVGYQACKYFDTFDLIRGDVELPFNFMGMPTQRVTDVITDSFDLRGPYLNITYHI